MAVPISPRTKVTNRQLVKGRISKRMFQENKVCQIFRKMKISYYPLIRTCTRAYQRVRNVRFSENLACFVFLKHPFWDLPFCFITDELILKSGLSDVSRMTLRKHFRKCNGDFHGESRTLFLDYLGWLLFCCNSIESTSRWKHFTDKAIGCGE